MVGTGESNGGPEPTRPDSPSDVGTVSGTGVTVHSSPDGEASLPPEEDLSGRVFAERYRIERKIGAGGMGHVYLGEHTTIGKTVAIKVLSAAYRSRADIVTRFLGEARAASALRHEHVVDITDYGSTPDGAVFIVMEYLEGLPLDDLLEREGPLSWRRAKTLMLQVLDALEAAHDKGIVHRDMKPDNCFVVPRSGGREHLKVLDFGIAKVMGGEGSEGLTETGAIMGTANYMSPEQAHGDKLDHRTDLYSCGVMLYEMLAGSRPFEANNPMSVMYKHLHAEVPPLLEVNPDCAAPGDAEYVLLRALAKDPGERFASAAEFAEALRAVPERGGVPLSSPGPTSPSVRGARASRSPARSSADAAGARGPGSALWWGLTAVVSLVAIGLAAWATTRSPKPPPAPVGEAADASAASPDVEADARPPDVSPMAPVPGGPSVEAAARSPSSEDAAPQPVAGETGEARPLEPDEGPQADPSGSNESSRSGAGATTRSTRAAKGRTPRSVRRALDKRAKRTVETCLQRGGAFPGEKVSARVGVDADGTVSSVKLGRKYASTPMGKCIEGALKSAKVPAGDERLDVTVNYAL